MQLYFVALVLPEWLNKEVLVYKKIMFERFGCQVGLNSPAHITLVPPFRLAKTNEEGLLADAHRVNEGQSPLLLETNNISAFPPRTLFVDVEPNEGLYALKQKTDECFSSQDIYKVKIDRRPFHPHITIATRDLDRKQFYEAWSELKDVPFRRKWVGEKISVLRHNGAKWDVLF
jgi:2'-5' RNA ligase